MPGVVLIPLKQGGQFAVAGGYLFFQALQHVVGRRTHQVQAGVVPIERLKVVQCHRQVGIPVLVAHGQVAQQYPQAVAGKG